MKLCSMWTKIVPQTVGKFAKKRCFLYVYGGFLMPQVSIPWCWPRLEVSPVVTTSQGRNYSQFA